MAHLRSLSKYCVAVVALMLLMTSVQVPVKAQSSLDQVVVLFDNSHNPQFDPRDADDGLKLMLDMVNASTRYMVRIFDGPELNDTILSDVDILIIAAPDENKPFTQTEVQAINEMLTNGSSLFILGNPCIDQTITEYWSDAEFQDIGENIALNNLLDSLNITDVRFSNNHTVSDSTERDWGDTMFDYDESLNSTAPYIIQFGASAWEAAHPIFKNINTIVTMTATLKPIGVVSSLAKGYDSSFAQYRRGPYTFGNTSFPNMSLEEFALSPYNYSAINGTFPSWLSAFTYNQSRVVIGGSTMMFSGMSLALPESDSRNAERWFYQGDNRLLFMNILEWLSQKDVDPPSGIFPVLVLSTILLAVGVVYCLVQKKRA
jgi:hypothetical protein